MFLAKTTVKKVDEYWRTNKMHSHAVPFAWVSLSLSLSRVRAQLTGRSMSQKLSAMKIKLPSVCNDKGTKRRGRLLHREFQRKSLNRNRKVTFRAYRLIALMPATTTIFTDCVDLSTQLLQPVSCCSVNAQAKLGEPCFSEIQTLTTAIFSLRLRCHQKYAF